MRTNNTDSTPLNEIPALTHTMTNNDRMFLGMVYTEIVGIRYYPGVVRPMERIRFFREPDNRHDTNAIRVENLRKNKVGYVPRSDAAWLAPLIDDDIITIDGGVYISGYDADQEFDKYHYPLDIAVYLADGYDFVHRAIPKPQNEFDVIHEMVRTAFVNTDDGLHWEAIYETGWKLDFLLESDLHPETALLIRLFPWKAEKCRKEMKESFGGCALTGLTLESVNRPDPAPEYRVHVNADGSVTFEGRKNVKKTGVHTWKVGKTVMELLFRALYDTDFLLLRDDEPLTDAEQCEAYRLTVSLDNDFTKQACLYPDDEDYLDFLVDIVNTIERTLNVHSRL